MGPHGQEALLDGFYELPYNMPPGFASAVGRDFNRWTANQQTWGIIPFCEDILRIWYK
jgi:hypothetical protein